MKIIPNNAIRMLVFNGAILIFLFSCSYYLSAQKCDEINFKRKMDVADSCIRVGNYNLAQLNYNAADVYCPAKSDEIEQAKNRLFEIINELRESANASRIIAEEATKRASEAKDSIQNVLNNIYFYGDRFGLAYDKKERKFGFIDKSMNIKIRFRYDEAKSFDQQGLALVSKDMYSNDLIDKDLAEYLIDTSGNEFLLSTRTSQIGYDTKAVDFSNSRYYFIPFKVTRQDQLRVLRINYSKLSKVPKRIGKLSYLQYLQCRNNRIIRLSPKIGELKLLQSLDLSGNHIKSLPKEIGGLMSLQVLNLYENELTELPAEIGKLKNLKSLSLWKNKLGALPVQICELKNLQQIDLRHNRIDSLPPEIRQMKSLKKMDLSKGWFLVDYVEQLRKDMPWCEIIFP